MSIENPGSIIDFATRKGIDPQKAINYYSEALDEYRRKLAEEKDMTIDELHEIVNPIGRLYLEEKQDDE